MTQPQWLIFYPIPWTRLPIHRIESKGTGVHILMAGTISPWTVICNTNLLLNRTIAQWSSVMAQKYGMLLIQNLSWIYTDSCERECQRSSKSRSGFLPQGKLTGWVRINRDRHSQHNNITIVVKIGSLHWKKRLACNNVVENRPEQYCSAKQCWTILLTNRNNMGSKILSRPVFNNIVTGWAFFCSVGWVGNISISVILDVTGHWKAPMGSEPNDVCILKGPVKVISYCSSVTTRGDLTLYLCWIALSVLSCSPHPLLVRLATGGYLNQTCPIHTG